MRTPTNGEYMIGATGKPEREKVIDALERCSYDPDPGQPRKEIFSCSDCPYYRGCYHGCTYGLMRDALALLKEQEARVMTREEVTATPEGTVVWMEEEAESGTYIQPIVSTGNGCLGNFYIGVGTYGVNLEKRRFWTSRPSEQQMRETPWEGEYDG